MLGKLTLRRYICGHFFDGIQFFKFSDLGKGQKFPFFGIVIYVFLCRNCIVNEKNNVLYIQLLFHLFGVLVE
jgi:hypothetical protein